MKKQIKINDKVIILKGSLIGKIGVVTTEPTKHEVVVKTDFGCTSYPLEEVALKEVSN
jgi:ribosomal protein L24